MYIWVHLFIIYMYASYVHETLHGFQMLTNKSDLLCILLVEYLIFGDWLNLSMSMYPAPISTVKYFRTVTLPHIPLSHPNTEPCVTCALSSALLPHWEFRNMDSRSREDLNTIPVAFWFYGLGGDTSILRDWVSYILKQGWYKHLPNRTRMTSQRARAEKAWNVVNL